MTAPSSFTYQWNADGLNVIGATDVNYKLTSSDADKVMSCTVTAHNSAGATSVTTFGTGPVSISSGAPNPGGGTRTPSWREEWDTFDLVTATNTEGLWAAAPNNISGMKGAKDPAGASWDANPNHDLGAPVGILNPFNLGPITDSTGASSDGNAMTFNIYPSTAAQESATGYANWGCFLQTNADVKSFGPGNYFEWRYLFSGSSSNMWPAIWLYGAEGRSGNVSSTYATAEFDVLEYCEPIAYTTVWSNSDSVRSQDGWDILGSVTDVWNVAGMDWQEDIVTFYKNGTAVGSYNAPLAMSWLSNATVGLRFDYTTRTNTAIPTEMSFSIDNIRVWPSFAASRWG
jgi:hypothetical protein